MIELKDHPAIAQTIRTGYPHDLEPEEEPYACPLCGRPLGDIWGEDDEGIVCIECLYDKVWLSMSDSDKFEALGFKVRRAGE